MPEVDFGVVKEELKHAGYMHVFPVLVRSSLFHGSDNRPATMIVTDKCIYWGGTVDRGNTFQRIPVKSINCLRKSGKTLWECIHISHMEIDGAKDLFVCPFKGEPSVPEKDMDSFELLLSLFNP